jgi:hypothetical protein
MEVFPLGRFFATFPVLQRRAGRDGSIQMRWALTRPFRLQFPLPLKPINAMGLIGRTAYFRRIKSPAEN